MDKKELQARSERRRKWAQQEESDPHIEIGRWILSKLRSVWNPLTQQQIPESAPVKEEFVEVGSTLTIVSKK